MDPDAASEAGDETDLDAPQTLADPSPSDAAAHVERALSRGDLVTIFGPCTVDYEGRASNYLDLAPRHVLCKPDGATLVHESEGQKPTNWQPPGATQSARVEGDIEETFVLRAERDSPEEKLELRFEAVQQVASFPAARSDAVELEVSGSEEQLRTRILDDPDLVEAGFTPLATERETAAGPVDIFGRDAEGNAVVVELKRRRVGPDAAGQLERYVDALRRDLHAEANVRGILVAPSVTDRARRMLAENGFEFVSLSP